MIGPYFFDGTVNAAIYLDLLQNVLPTLLVEVDLNTRLRMWFQQDGAPPHYANSVRNFLNGSFRNRWIGRTGPVEWPPRSPDLTSPDFFLWGYIKNLIFQKRPTTQVDMRERITLACNQIPRNVLLSTAQHFQRRIVKCVEVNGATFEHLIK